MWIRGDPKLCPTIKARLVRWVHSELTLYDIHNTEGSGPVLSRTKWVAYHIRLGLSRRNPRRTGIIFLVDFRPVARRVENSPKHEFASSLRIRLPLLGPLDL